MVELSSSVSPLLNGNWVTERWVTVCLVKYFSCSTIWCMFYLRTHYNNYTLQVIIIQFDFFCSRWPLLLKTVLSCIYFCLLQLESLNWISAWFLICEGWGVFLNEKPSPPNCLFICVSYDEFVSRDQYSCSRSLPESWSLLARINFPDENRGRLVFSRARSHLFDF